MRASSPEPPVVAARPLLKWAGGKRQLLPHLRRFYPDTFGAYIEPFFGSGAVFFDLHSAGRLRNRDVVLIDSNADLMGCYETVRAAPDEVARPLDDLAAAHARDGRARYYQVRDDRFNPLRDAPRRRDGRIGYTPELATMLIYLNRTGFNGLFRVNGRGAFNVPAGRYARPKIVDRDKLARAADALSGARVRLVCGSYESVDTIAALYEHNRASRAAGLHTFRIRARRAINSKAAGRGLVDEFLITNLEPRTVNREP